jgi:peptidoglycan/xylan/chitin deacetylase (PgdA/CDA1 family)
MNRENSLILTIIRLLIFFVRPKRSLVVLTFHNIIDSEMEWLRSTLETLADKYSIVDPKNIEARNINKSNKIELIVSFDDGFLSNRVVAEKILKPLGIKALFFITKDFIGLNINEAFEFSSKNIYPQSVCDAQNKSNYRAMDWNDLDWLTKENHLIGAHSSSHINIKKVKQTSVLMDEIVHSANYISSKTGKNVDHYAFPFGTMEAINKTSLSIAANRFKYIYSNVRGNFAESPGVQFIFRQNIVPGDPLWLVCAFIEGKFDWVYKKARNKAHVLLGACDLS